MSINDRDLGPRSGVGLDPKQRFQGPPLPAQRCRGPCTELLHAGFSPRRSWSVTVASLSSIDVRYSTSQSVVRSGFDVQRLGEAPDADAKGGAQGLKPSCSH